MLLHAVLAFALLETALLAGLLWAFADRVAGARLLLLFLGGVELWVVGNELPNWFGLGWGPVAIALLAMAPVVSAVFFHFCVVLCRAAVSQGVIAAAYAIGGLATLVAEFGDPARLELRPHIGYIAVPNVTGVVLSVVWAGLGLAGLAVLVRGLMRTRPPERNQIAAVSASYAWGFFSLTGYGIAAAGWPMYPWPLLALPAYTLILVYGVLRYRVFVVNAWARRALAWALLLALGAGVVAVTLLLPFESRWLSGLVVAVTCFALGGPVRRFAERLIYPGGDVSAADLAQWRTALLTAETAGDLAAEAARRLGARIGLDVCVAVGDEAAGPADAPRIVCRPGDPAWSVELQGWDAAPPGPRRVAEMFGSVVAEAALRVAQAQQLAARERERQLQARLAELGALAATVAHDIRNPLNIISMAAASSPPDTRREVAEQVARIGHLTSDLLDYAKPWKLATSPIDLAAVVRRAALRTATVELGRGLDGELTVQADARRVEQALANLIDNARSLGTKVHVEAEVDAAGATHLHVCDDGPGVPEEIRDRLFEPFASRSPNGTGLGLAIVARVMSAHGGRAALTIRPPWATCFTLSFPAPP
jgi:signal transduction histidine kinase